MYQIIVRLVVILVLLVIFQVILAVTHVILPIIGEMMGIDRVRVLMGIMIMEGPLV
jgi:hypothetical protein